MVNVACAKIIDLVSLGLEYEVAVHQINGGCAYVVFENEFPRAAYGLFESDINELELWFAGAPRLASNRAKLCLLRHCINIIHQKNKDAKIVAFKAPNAVAFEKLALLCGMRIEGFAPTPWGNALMATIGGG